MRKRDRLACLLASLFIVSVAAGTAVAADKRDTEAAKLFYEGNYEGAVKLFIALALETKNPAYMCNIGRCYARLGRVDDAINNIRDCLAQAKLDPRKRTEYQGQLDELVARGRTAPGATTPADEPSAAASSSPAAAAAVAEHAGAAATAAARVRAAAAARVRAAPPLQQQQPGGWGPPPRSSSPTAAALATSRRACPLPVRPRRRAASARVRTSPAAWAGRHRHGRGVRPDGQERVQRRLEAVRSQAREGGEAEQHHPARRLRRRRPRPRHGAHHGLTSGPSDGSRASSGVTVIASPTGAGLGWTF